MTQEEFDIVLEARFKKAKHILSSKAKEYARGDRLSNFKRAASAQNMTPEQALVGMWMKHVISICDLANDLALGIESPYSLFDEKIGDSLNYMLLLDALVTERLGIK